MRIKNLKIGDGFWLSEDCKGGYYSLHKRIKGTAICYKGSSNKPFEFDVDRIVWTIEPDVREYYKAKRKLNK